MLEPLKLLLIAGMIGGLLCVLFWPERGLLVRWARQRRCSERIRIEDALKHIQKSEINGCSPTLQSVAGTLQLPTSTTMELLTKMECEGLIVFEANQLGLTPAGRELALHVLRAHRLLESYLADQTGYDEVEWHGQAEILEHQFSPEDVANLEAQLGYPEFDPHGHPIPTQDGDLAQLDLVPLSLADRETPYRISHIADYPETVHAQIVAEGLHVGMEVRLIEKTDQRVRFWAEDGMHVLAPVIAANVALLSMPKPVSEAKDPQSRLSMLEAGQKATIRGIASTCRAVDRRRLLDFGFLPGVMVEAAFANPNGDPMAYRIRDTLIALRDEQAEHIFIQPEDVVA